jgi:UDP-N-acetylglucosamine 2-epimerase (non-hydrolysing)
MLERERGAMPSDLVLHLVTSRSSLVRLSPVADALASRQVPQVFFEPFAPADHAVHVPSGGPPHTRGLAAAEHGTQLGAEALTGMVEDALSRYEPATMVVAGDAHASVVGALAASRMGVRVARVGAGLRCDDWGLREEVTRVALDAIADELFTDGPDATHALASQGIAGDRVLEVGSTLADSVHRWRSRAAVRTAWRGFGLNPREFVLTTIHRDENLRDDERVRCLTRGLARLARRHRVLFVMHPRTYATLDDGGQLEDLQAAGVVISGPLDHVEFLSLELGAGAILTDSAGSQEEATVLGVPCFTLRRSSERSLTLTHGTNTLLGDDPAEVADIEVGPPRDLPPIPYWDGRAGQRVADHLLRCLAERCAEA